MPTRKRKQAAKRGKTKTVYAVPALEKGFDIIELLAEEPDGLTPSEIAQRLGRSLSEIFRVLVVMERRNWLQKNSETDRYVVGYHALKTAFHASPIRSLSAVAGQAMYELSKATVQSCHLAIMTDNIVLIVMQQASPAYSGFGVRLGARVHPTRNSSGRVLLAFSEPELVDAVSHSVELSHADDKKLRARLGLIHKRGYEIHPSVRTMGITEISYPVFGFDGRIRAALTMPFLTVIDVGQTTGIEDARRHLERTAQHISNSLGWLGDTAARTHR